MKIRKIALYLLAFALAPIVVHAQTAMTSTTLSGAVTKSQNTIPVASATGIVAPNPFGGPAQTPGLGTVILIDNELMYVESVNGTTITVQRGAGGTKQTSHNSGAVVWVGSPNSFLTTDPVGPCTADLTTNPTIVTTTAYNTRTRYWNCVEYSSGNYIWAPVLTTGSITPAATSAAIQTSAQTFTVKGLVTGEPINVVSAPAPTSLCPLTGASVTAANTVSLYFTTLTAAACTPASGTYLFQVSRFDP